MHIAIDARAYVWTGIGRYIKNILREFGKIAVDHSFIILARREDIPLIRSDIGTQTDRFQFRAVEPSYYSVSEQTKFLWQLGGIDADLFHFTHFNVPLLFRRPFVITIHDITRFIFPGQKRQHLLQQIGYEYIFSRATSHAKAVICVSEFTQSQLQALPFKTIPKTHVVYEGIENQFFLEIPRTLRQKARMLIGTQDDYILYVGVWMSHKNIGRLLAAFKIVLDGRPRCKLVITGKPVPSYINAIKMSRDLSVERSVIFPGFVPQELLPALYAEAKCFVFPSLYEGFGLPPLEASACGTPVVASNVSSLPEVLAEAAEYVNPENVEDIARGIRRVLENQNIAQSLVDKGIQRARQFQWGKTVEAHMKVYEETLNI